RPVRPAGHRRRRQRHRRPQPLERGPPPLRPDRLRAHLRPHGGGGLGPAGGLRPDPGAELAMSPIDLVSSTSTLAAGASTSFPVLPAMVVLPILGALVIALIPRSRPDLHKLTAIITAVTTGALTLWVLWNFQTGD